MPRSFVLLHTNDMHGRLTAGMAERIRAKKAREENVLLVDAGDALRAGNLGVPLRPEVALARMGQAGYDLMGAGNRETHLWRWALRAKLRGVSFPVLCANVSGPGAADGPGAASPATLYHRHVRVCLPNGLRVAFFGLTVPMVTAGMAARHVSHYLFQNPIETARVLVPEVAAEADVVVAMTHLGLAQDRELASEVPGIHVIVGGHTHDLLPGPVVVNGTTILQAGGHASHLGRAEVVVEDRRVAVTWRTIPLREEPGGAPRQL